MKKFLLLFLSTSILFACSNADTSKQNAEKKSDSEKPTTTSKDTTKKSIPASVSKRIGNTEVTISYHSPGVRGRTIWGGLVPFNEIWVTGAHKATSIEVGEAFQIGGKVIPSGKYALFTIPGKEEWTVVINKNWSQHLADDYSQEEDVVRVKVKPQLVDEITERLKYEINPKDERTADIIISWEKVKVPFPIEIR